jgi:hypothetical protein
VAIELALQRGPANPWGAGTEATCGRKLFTTIFEWCSTSPQFAGTTRSEPVDFVRAVGTFTD